jgi:hypothetical protein
MKPAITLSIYAAFLIAAALTPIVVAHRREHPRRWLITALAVPCTAFCSPIPLIVWAFWPIPMTVQLDHYCYKIPKPENLFALFEADHDVFVIAVQAYCSAAEDSYQKEMLIALIGKNKIGWTNSRYVELAATAKRLKTHTLNWKQVSEVFCDAGKRNLNQLMNSRPNQ